MTPAQIAKHIQFLEAARVATWQAIEAIVRAEIPDYHFLDYRVSTFWPCAKSPVGMCVFKLDEYGRSTECRYCGGPVERK